MLLSESFDGERALENWTVRTNGTVGRDAGVRVVDGELRLRVFRCHEAIAERRFATDADRIRASFAWRTAAEEWYEYPDWRLLAPNDSARNDTLVAGRDVSRPDMASRRGGRVVTTASAGSETRLRFSIRPSQYCGRSNHRNTTLWVDDLTVVEQSPDR